MEKVDRKYHGQVFKADGTPVPEEEIIVFRATDKAVPEMLEAYYNKCKELGADVEHLTAVNLLYKRVISFQEENPERCKVPDTTQADLFREL